MRTAAPLLGKGKCSKSYAGGDVQPEFICIYHLHLPSRLLQQARGTAAASHLPRAPGWASINNWGLDRAGRSAPAGSHSLVAGRRRRGLTEPLGRGGASVSKIAQSLISAPQPVRHRPQVARLREFSLPMPAATHDQRIGRSPRFGRIGPAAQLS